MGILGKYRQIVVMAFHEGRRDHGYCRLLRVCRSAMATVARFVLRTVFCTAGVIVGVALAGSLPASTGSVVVLADIFGAAAGAIAGWWLAGTALRIVRAAVQWCAASVALRAPAPAPPFSGRARGDGVRTKLTVAMALAVPVLIFWGPIVGTLTLVHGFADQRLVSLLRQHGVSTTGHVVDVPAYSRGYGDDSPGYFDGQNFTAVTYSVGLVFKAADGRTVLAPAPAIGGSSRLSCPRPSRSSTIRRSLARPLSQTSFAAHRGPALRRGTSSLPLYSPQPCRCWCGGWSGRLAGAQAPVVGGPDSGYGVLACFSRAAS